MAEKIIINFPTNIGDVVLALPVIDRARANFPDAELTAIASPRTYDFLKTNTSIDKVIFYDKRWKIREKIKFWRSLRNVFTIMVDLKNSILPFLLRIPKRTPYIRTFPKNLHITEKYLFLTKGLFAEKEASMGMFRLDDALIKKWQAYNLKPSIVIACSSRLKLKRYSQACLQEAVSHLKKIHPIIVIGMKEDAAYYGDMLNEKEVCDLTGKTSMAEVFYILKNYARGVVGVDSSILHAASYLRVPVVALFGPTHPERSRPRTERSFVLWQKELACTPCESSKCGHGYRCMEIPAEKVVAAVKELLEGEVASDRRESRAQSRDSK